MKKFLLVPMIAAALTLPLMAEEERVQNTQVTEQVSQEEPKLIDEVLADYRSGKYNHFLKEADSAYEEGNKKWEYNSLLEERKKLSSVVNDYQSGKTDRFKKEITALHDKQDREMVELCLNHPEATISLEVRDMVFFTPSQEEQRSLDYLHSLSHKFKGDGTTPLENKLINIDTEFWLKSISLSVALTQNKVDPETYQKKHLVLQLEKIKQMQVACEGDLVDVKIKGHIDTAAAVLPKVQASAATRKHLHALAQGKITPQNDVEKELQTIGAKYLKEEQTLMEKHFPNSSN